MVERDDSVESNIITNCGCGFGSGTFWYHSNPEICPTIRIQFLFLQKYNMWLKNGLKITKAHPELAFKQHVFWRDLFWKTYPYLNCFWKNINWPDPYPTVIKWLDLDFYLMGPYTVTKANQNEALLWKIAVREWNSPLLVPEHFFSRPMLVFYIPPCRKCQRRLNILYFVLLCTVTVL